MTRVSLHQHICALITCGLNCRNYGKNDAHKLDLIAQINISVLFGWFRTNQTVHCVCLCEPVGTILIFFLFDGDDNRSVGAYSHCASGTKQSCKLEKYTQCDCDCFSFLFSLSLDSVVFYLI